MNDQDEHDDLWALLGRAKSAEVSPFFSRDVLRCVRAAGGREEGRGFAHWLGRFWPAATIGAGAAGLLAFAALNQAGEIDPLRLLAHQVSASPDYQVINHLDELLDSERNAAWLDPSGY